MNSDIKSQKTLPAWIIVVSGLFALMETIMGLALIFAPQTTLDSIDQTSNDAKYLIQMWAIRQVALGIILGYAALEKSGAMLHLGYLFLIVMFIGDAFVGYFQENSSNIIGAAIMLVFSATLFWFTRTK